MTETKYDPVTKLPLVQFTRLNGLLQATPDDGPSYILYDEQGRPKLMEWHDKDVLHREGAGATITMDTETNVQVFESFFTDGKPRERHLGPYRIIRNRTTGHVERELFHGDVYFPTAPDIGEPP